MFLIADGALVYLQFCIRLSKVSIWPEAEVVGKHDARRRDLAGEGFVDLLVQGGLAQCIRGCRVLERTEVPVDQRTRCLAQLLRSMLTGGSRRLLATSVEN